MKTANARETTSNPTCISDMGATITANIFVPTISIKKAVNKLAIQVKSVFISLFNI